MSEPASEVYEIVLEPTSTGRKFFRSAFVFFVNLPLMGMGPRNPGGMIISVIDKVSGDELFRHVEDMGDDEGHLLDGIQHDLATMTADEFATTWTT